MSNPFNNIINQNFIDKFNYAIEEVIRANLTPARLIYPKTKWIDCPNCGSDIYSNSPNPYLRGQTSTACATCGGTGKIAQDATEDITIAVVFNYKKFNNIVNGLVVTPNADAYTLSSNALIGKLKTCGSIVFNTGLEKYNKHEYVRDGEPSPIGLGDPKFILTNWKVVG